MSRRTVAMTALFGAAGLALAGCGLSGTDSGESEEAGSTGEAAASIAEVTDEELEGTVITMARFFGPCIMIPSIKA